MVQISRRAIILGAVASASTASTGLDVAFADTATWREKLIRNTFGTVRPYIVRKFEGTEGRLECLDADGLGFMVVDTRTREFLEWAQTPSPVAGVEGPVAYLGPGLWYSREQGSWESVFDGSSLDDEDVESQADSLTLNLTTLASAQEHSSTVNPTGGPYGNGWLIKNYEFVRDCTVLPNHSGICGWVAAAMVLRFWHARNPRRGLIESKYLSGTNLRPTTSESSNLASAIRNSRSGGTWGKSVRDALIDYTRKRSLPARSTYYLFSAGIHEEIRAHRPVILYGSLPKPGASQNVMHAVVCYGFTSKGDNIVHYGWKGYSRVVLRSGFVGSTTQYQLK